MACCEKILTCLRACITTCLDMHSEFASVVACTQALGGSVTEGNGLRAGVNSPGATAVHNNGSAFFLLSFQMNYSSTPGQDVTQNSSHRRIVKLLQQISLSCEMEHLPTTGGRLKFYKTMRFALTPDTSVFRSFPRAFGCTVILPCASPVALCIHFAHRDIRATVLHMAAGGVGPRRQHHMHKLGPRGSDV